MRTATLAVAVAAAAIVAPAAHAGPNLLANPSFEQPNVGTGWVGVATGQSFPGWKVVGKPGNVAPISGAFQQNGFVFPALEGRQWIDLTGTSNSATGIAQAVTTTAGARYRLSFGVGTVGDPGGIFGTTSTVEALVDGKRVQLAQVTSASKRQVWKRFVVSFVAAGPRTTVTFVNRDPSNDNHNGLDAVSLTAG